MSTIDEGNPQVLLDWLIVQHTCEWCGETIGAWFDQDHNPIVPEPAWRCREVKHNGWTSRHWKYWRICQLCSARLGSDFIRWVFPVIKEIMPEHMGLDAIVQVQPLAQPAGEIMYMDYVHGPTQEEVRRRKWDFAKRYAEKPVDPANYVTLDGPDTRLLPDVFKL